MSHNFFAYSVLGVRAKDYITEKEVKIQKQKIDCGEKLFKEDGTPILKTECIHYKEFNDLFFFNFETNKEDLKQKNIHVQEISICDYLRSYGLKWVSYDYNTIYSSDLIGFVICNITDKNEGIEENQLPDLFKKASEKLKEVGINEIPKLFTGFFHSY